MGRNYYFQIGDDVKMNMSIESAYNKSIETLVLWIKNEVDFNRTQVIFRTYAPAHNRLVSIFVFFFLNISINYYCLVKFCSCIRIGKSASNFLVNRYCSVTSIMVCFI